MSSSSSSSNNVIWLALLMMMMMMMMMVSSSMTILPQVLGFHMMPLPLHPIHVRQLQKQQQSRQTANLLPLSSLSSSSSSPTSQRIVSSFTGLAMKTQNDMTGDEPPKSILSSSQSTNNETTTSTTLASPSSSSASNKNKNNVDKNNVDINIKSASSKRQMLGFAIPALGIYLSNPLLSNIDNAFVGHMVGTKGLAALSPATICTDQMLYLFSFLARATTGLVSRAYGRQQQRVDVVVQSDNDDDNNNKEQQQQQGNTEAAREAGSPPLTAALVCGVGLSIMYALATPQLLSLLHVNPSLRSSAASYVYWRGAVAWAALSQSVALSMMMATRDAITPLKIIGLSAVLNIIGDYLLCVWPLQWGCGGAAAATAMATLVSSGCMIQALQKKKLLPTIRIPTKQQLWDLMEFTGPLMAITITRLIGFVSMQRTAMQMGVQSTAAYQLSINLVVFFLLFGEPLSQLSQTKLPALIDAQQQQQQQKKESSSISIDDNDNDDNRSSNDTTLVVRETYKSVLALGAWTALGIGSIAGLLLRFGSGLFSTDIAVQELAQAASPAVFINVAIAIFAVTVDGTMLASRDFGFMLVQGLGTCCLQLFLLKNWCTNISQIYHTFSLRLGSYAVTALLRTVLGKGALGRAIRPKVSTKQK